MDNQEQQLQCQLQAGEFHNEPTVSFNTMSDLTQFVVKSQDTQESLFEITGYGLQIRFNREKIRSIVDVENLVDGIKDLFRNIVLQEMLPPDNSEETK